MTTIGAALLGGAWLWEKFGEKVVEHFSRQGSDIVHEAWNKTSWKDAAENYRGEMQRLYSTMRIIGMAEPVALADIFTDAYLLDKPSAWRRYNIDELKHQVQSEGEQRREQRHDALDLIRRHECLMILGKPGAGKTTLMKHLVLQCTTGRFDAVPIFVGLKDWADSNLALMPFLQNQFTICAFPDAQPFIEQILKVGKALVLFDGLDEVNLEQGARERIIREVRDL
jgi:predicted NACHT family NTPase